MRPPAELIQQLCKVLAKSKTADLPRYKALYEALRQQILDGLLLPGMCLPSSRVLSGQLSLSRNTILAALGQLCAEGYTAAQPKSGIYVLSTAPVNWQTSPLISTSIKLNLSQRGKNIAEQSQMAPMRGAFAPGVPDLKQFPFELWQRYVARHARNPKLDWQANPHLGGDAELRQIMAHYLRIVRSIRCEEDQILITNGTQRSLQLVANLLADRNDRVWMEDPGYAGARCAFAAAGLTIINQPVDEYGLSPKVNAWKKPPRFIYTTPSHQFPTGVVMSAARRRNLLALAAKHQTWVIEDDYDSEFRYEGTPLAALQALAPEQVIYLGTFSKTFFPSLQIGYMVLPKQLVEAFRATQARHHREPSYVIQKALADFIRDGHASAHIRKMRREYQARRDTLVELLNDELGELIHLGGLDTGLHIVAYLPPQLNAEAIADKAFQHGITMSALKRYYAEPISSHSSALVLGFGDADQQHIMRAGKMLSQIIRQAVKSSNKRK